MPAQPVEAARKRHGGAAHRQRRHDLRLRWVGRIAGQTRSAHHAVIQVVERCQRRVVDRPVIGHAIQRSHPEVGGVESWRVGTIQHGAAAHRVEVCDLNRRVVLVDRVVSQAPAAVGVDGEAPTVARLGVATRRGIFGRVHPVALLQTHDVHLRFGQTPGHRSARSARSDDQDVNLVQHLRTPMPGARMVCAPLPGPAATSRPAPTHSLSGTLVEVPAQATSVRGRHGSSRAGPRA